MKSYNRPPIVVGKKKLSVNKIWSDDLFYRKNCAGVLTNLLSDGTDPVVIAVNGEWGSGKTFFLERWVQELVNKKYKAIYYNAWEDDDFDDPIVSIVGQLSSWFKDRETITALSRALSKNMVPLLKGVSLSIVSSLLTKLTGVDCGEIKKEVVETATEGLIDAYKDKVASRNEIRTKLAEIAKSTYSRTGQYLVLVIDELDRCRPTYAISVLERIKHILNVPYLAVVLGIDKGQLAKSICAVYGDIDIENYLHRFIDIDFLMPTPDQTTYMKFLWDRYGIEEYFTTTDERKNFLASMRKTRVIMSCFCKMHQFSLREVETAFKTFVLLFRTKKTKRVICPELVAALIVLKIVSPDDYRFWMCGKLPVHKVVDALLPVEDELNFPSAMDVVAALYATHYKESAAIASSANRLLNVIAAKKLKADEIYCDYPKCLKHRTARFLSSFLGKVERMRAGDVKRVAVTYNAMQRLARMMELISEDNLNHVGIKDGVAVVTI